MSREEDEDPMNWSVGDFLRTVQEILVLRFPNSVLWHEVPKRDEEIAELNLTKPLVLEELAKLTPAHHHAGPEKDDWDDRCALQKFRYPLDAHTLVYVKIGLKQHPKRHGVYFVKVYSFKRWQ